MLFSQMDRPLSLQIADEEAKKCGKVGLLLIPKTLGEAVQKSEIVWFNDEDEDEDFPEID